MKQKSIILFLCLMVALGGRAQTSTKEVTLKTTAGDICIALYDETPLHRDNFLSSPPSPQDPQRKDPESNNLWGC